MTSKLFRTAALGLMLLLAASVSVAGTPTNPYVATVSATQANTTTTFSFDTAGTVFISNDGANEVYVRWNAAAVAAATTNIQIPAYKSKSFTFAPGKGPSSVGIICSAGETSTVRVEAYADEGGGTGAGVQVTEGGAASTVSGAQTIGSLATTTTMDVGTDLTVGGTAGVTGVATFTAAPVFSSATASRIMVTGAGKALASNAAITANTVAKGTAGGIVDSNITDDAATITLGGPAVDVSGTLDVTGIATFDVAPVASALTASRLVVTGAGKALASNGAITTNAIPKSASSGATLADSSISDDGTTVSTTEPLSVSGASITGKLLIVTPQTQTVADSGDGNPAAATVTPTSSQIQVTCNDANGCALTFSEVGATNGAMVKIINASAANSCTIADSAGVQETTGGLTLTPLDSVDFIYFVDTWLQTTAVVAP